MIRKSSNLQQASTTYEWFYFWPHSKPPNPQVTTMRQASSHTLPLREIRKNSRTRLRTRVNADTLGFCQTYGPLLGLWWSLLYGLLFSVQFVMGIRGFQMSAAFKGSWKIKFPRWLNRGQVTDSLAVSEVVWGLYGAAHIPELPRIQKLWVNVWVSTAATSPRGLGREDPGPR